MGHYDYMIDVTCCDCGNIYKKNKYAAKKAEINRCVRCNAKLLTSRIANGEVNLKVKKGARLR